MWRALSPEPRDANERLDHVLSRRLGLSRGAVRRMLTQGAVRINGHLAGAGVKGRVVGAEDRIEVETDAAAPAPRPTPNLVVPLVAAGEGWVIVNKPAGMPVHPLRPDEDATVLNALVKRYPGMVGVGEGGLRSGVVHRLDIETTGCLLFATVEPMWQRLREAFKSRAVRKRYLAIVAGRVVGEATETMHLAVTQHRPARVRVVPASHRQSRRCTLAWRSLAATDAASLLEIDLDTGFLHQIRVMLAAKGHPLVGDAVYGGPLRLETAEGAVDAARPMLHAHALEVEAARGMADLPADFEQVRSNLGL